MNALPSSRDIADLVVLGLPAPGGIPWFTHLTNILPPLEASQLWDQVQDDVEARYGLPGLPDDRAGLTEYIDQKDGTR